MRAANRVLALLLIGALLALAAILFGPFLSVVVLAPLAGQLWGFLRIFILCLNQEELWSYVVLALFVFLCYRLLRALAAASPELAPERGGRDANTALGELEYWRYMFAKPPRDERERVLCRRELARLLVSAYSTSNRVEANFELLESFRSGRIALPETVHELLFGGAGDARTPRGARRLGVWLRRASGREGADYRKAIGEYLDFVAFQMEMVDDER